MKVLWLLIFLIACVGKAGIIVPEYRLPSWAAPPKNFSFSASEITPGSQLNITVGPADYAWGEAYVYTDSKRWEKIVINPLLTKDKIVNKWVKGSARFTLTIRPEKFTQGNIYYVLGYWCNKKNGWDCNGQRWMLLSFKVKKTITITEEIDQLASELIMIEKEFNVTYEEDEVAELEEMNYG